MIKYTMANTSSTFQANDIESIFTNLKYCLDNGAGKEWREKIHSLLKSYEIVQSPEEGIIFAIKNGTVWCECCGAEVEDKGCDHPDEFKHSVAERQRKCDCIHQDTKIVLRPNNKPEKWYSSDHSIEVAHEYRWERRKGELLQMVESKSSVVT
jgi:hypothetical protein